jgi:DNA-binding CsgD family transcriptional regulator
MSEALYQEIPSLRRRRLHDEAGRALEVLHGRDLGPRLADLARHCCASLPVGPFDRAVTYARLAGDRAVQQLAYEEGARLFRMALRAFDGSGATLSISERAELLLALGDALSKGGDIAAAQATYLDAADLARRAGNADQLAHAALEYGGRFVWMRAGTDRHLIPLLLEALAAVPQEDSEVRVRLLARLEGAKRDEVSGDARDELSAQAVAIAERLDDPATLAYALIARGLAINSPQTSWKQLELAERAIDLAESANHAEHAAAARLFRFLALASTGPGEAVRPALEDYSRMAEELRQPSHRWYSDVVRASVMLIEGRLAEAEALLDRARTAGERAQSWDAGATNLLLLAMLRWEQGRLPEVEESLVSAQTVYPGYRLFRCVLALACLEAGRPDEARGLATEIVAGADHLLPMDNGWLFGVSMLAETAERVDDEALASRLYEPLLPYAPFVGMGSAEISCGSIHRPLGQLASLLGHTDDALAHFEAARLVDRAYRADIWITHTDVCEAAARLRRGTDEDRRAAAKLLQAAGETSARRGWVALAKRVEELRGADKRSELPGGLTPREVEVARLVARGLSNRDIAETFVLSERTVESHVQHILTKLSFSSRAEIAAWAVRTGLDAST